MVRTVTYRIEACARLRGRAHAAEARRALHGEDGWAARGVVFTEVAPGQPAQLVLHLASDGEVVAACGPSFGGLSCAELGGTHAYVNADRWLHGAEGVVGRDDAAGMSTYRAYLVRHEVGHVLGFEHEECGPGGGPAAIMTPQTYRLGGCTLSARVGAGAAYPSLPNH